MNLFFDEVSQQIIINAKKEMYQLKHPYVGSEHLFLSLLHNTDLEVTKKLNSLGISYDKFKEELIRVVGLGSKCNNWFLFTPLLKRIINNAAYYNSNENNIITPDNLLISILQEGDGIANRILLGMNIDLNYLYDLLVLNQESISNSFKNDLLEEIGINMNEMSLNNKYDSIIGRENEVDRLIQILLRKNKSNPLLIGEAGVGKTALVEELARRVVTGNVPVKLKNIIIYNVSMSSLVAGTKYRGEFEEKINRLLNDVVTNSNIILFIDEVHTIMGAGGAEGAIDASNILKPYLARGDIKVIGATTLDEYNKYIKKDKAFDRRFQKLYIKEASKNEVTKIIGEVKSIYENYHGVYLSPEIINTILDCSFNCIFFGRQPDRTIDLLDEICSYASFSHNKKNSIMFEYEKKIKDYENEKNRNILKHDFKEALLFKEKEFDMRSKYNTYLFNNNKDEIIKVELDDVYHILYLKGNAIDMVELKNRIKISKSNILSEVFGQKEVINNILNKLSKYDYINNKSPFSFLFIGKNGVGKTFLISKLISNIFYDVNVINLNMNEFHNEYSINRITGSINDSSFIYDNCVFSSIKENSFSIVILEDIDKAHPKVIKILLDAISNGIFSTNNGDKINISKCIIIMTTNMIISNVGFVDKNKDIFNFNSIFDKISNIIYFNDITKKSINEYLKSKYKSNYLDISKRIINELNYEELGFCKMDALIKNM